MIRMFSAIAVVAALTAAAPAGVLYLNTWDDTGNINISDDTTDAASFWTYTGGGAVSEAAGVTGNAASFTGVVGSNPGCSDAGPGSAHFDSVTALINTLPEGDYEVTFEADYVCNDSASWRLKVNMYTDTGTRIIAGTNPVIAPTADLNTWGHATYTLNFSLGAGSYPVFPVGHVGGWQVNVEIDNRQEAYPVTVLLDNLAMTSTSIVPEPASMSLVGLGGLLVLRRRRRS